MPMLFTATNVPADVLQLAAQFSAQAEPWEKVGQKLAARYDGREAASMVEGRIYEKVL